MIQQKAPPPSGLAVFVNYTPPDGRIGSIPVDATTIADTEPRIAAAVQDARKLGTDVTVRFVARTGHCVSQWRAGP